MGLRCGRREGFGWREVVLGRRVTERVKVEGVGWKEGLGRIHICFL